MSLEKFGEELRKQREQKQISLAAISEATRISEKMLEAIEAGNFSVLPQAYIRAFIKAYAAIVDLNGDEVLHRYDEVNGEIRAAAEEWINRSKPHRPAVERTAVELPAPQNHMSIQSIIAAVAILTMVAAVIYFASRESAIPSQEPLSNVPFDRAIHESEAAVVKNEPAPVKNEPASVKNAQAPAKPAPTVARDSLRLEIATTDSVWVSITIDNVRKGEYLFPPGRTRSWAARDQFLVSLGNAGAATFRLNGESIGSLGKRGAVERNVLITPSGVQRTQ